MKILPLVIVVLVLNHIAFNGGRIAVSLYALNLKASPFTVGVLLASYALLPALLSVAAGRWIDRIGFGKPMLLGTVGVGMGTIVPFLFPSLEALYVTAILSGVSFMLINVGVYLAVGELSAPEDRPVNFSYAALGFSVSSFIGPLVTGLGIDELGFRTTFLVLALFCVMPLILLNMGLLPARAPKPAIVRDGKGNVFDLLDDRDLRRLFVTMAILTVSWDVYGFVIPLHGTGIGLSASQIGIVMGAFAAATFSVRLLLPFFVNRVKPWSLLTGALLTAGLGFALLPMTHSVVVMMALMFILGLGLGAPQPTVLTLLHQSAPEGRAGEALGLRTTMINASQTVMPIAFGALSDAYGTLPLFLGMAALLFVGGAMAQRLRRGTH
jgi:MFS family permease